MMEDQLITVNGYKYLKASDRWFVLVEVKDENSIQGLETIYKIHNNIAPAVDAINKNYKDLKK